MLRPRPARIRNSRLPIVDVGLLVRKEFRKIHFVSRRQMFLIGKNEDAVPVESRNNFVRKRRRMRICIG